MSYRFPHWSIYAIVFCFFSSFLRFASPPLALALSLSLFVGIDFSRLCVQLYQENGKKGLGAWGGGGWREILQLTRINKKRRETKKKIKKMRAIFAEEKESESILVVLRDENSFSNDFKEWKRKRERVVSYRLSCYCGKILHPIALATDTITTDVDELNDHLMRQWGTRDRCCARRWEKERKTFIKTALVVLVSASSYPTIWPVAVQLGSEPMRPICTDIGFVCVYLYTRLFAV